MEWSLGRCRRFICYIIDHYIWHLLTICTCAVALLLAAIATTMQVEGSVCHEVIDLKDLTHALMNISDWRSLGYELSVPHNTIESIEHTETGIENKQRAVLRAWYNLQDHNPCWHSVTDVLRQLNQNYLATKIDQCAEYIQSGTDCDVTTCVKKGVNECKFSYSISPRLLGLTAVLVLTAVCLYFVYTILEQATFTYQKQFARENQATIKAKFADFQTKVCDKLVKNGVKIETFRLFVVNQFPPGEFIPPSPASLFEIFETITQHGLWNYFHYSPLVKVVEKFGGGDSEMEGWVNNYRKSLKAYCIVTNVEKYVETYLHNSPSAESTKHDLRYYQTVEWKTEFIDHSLQYLAEVWESFSCHYLVPDSPPTALLDHVRKGCFSITWLVPSSLIPTLIEKVKIDTNFFQQHHIVRVTVGKCIYDEVVEKSTLPSAQLDFNTSEQKHPQYRSSDQHGVERLEAPPLRYTGPLTTKQYHKYEEEFTNLYLSAEYEQMQKLSKQILISESISTDIKVFALCWEALSEAVHKGYEDAERSLRLAWERASKLECVNGLLLQGRVLRHLAHFQFCQGNDDKALEYMSEAKQRLFNAVPSNETALALYTELRVKRRQLLSKTFSSKLYMSLEKEYELLLEHAKYMEEYEKPVACNFFTMKASFHLRSDMITDKLPSKECWPSDDDVKKAENCLKKDTRPSQINAYTARYYRTLCDLHIWKHEYPEAMHYLEEAKKVYDQMKVKGNNSLQRVDQRLKLLERLKDDGRIDEMQKNATV